MASGRKRVREVDYSQLNSFSSAVLFDTAPKRKKTKFYEVERVITRRRANNDFEYLIKWKGWSLDCSSWEPSSNLTAHLLRNFSEPVITDSRLEDSCRSFSVAISSALRSRCSSPIYLKIDLDVWRYATYGKGTKSEHRGHHLLEKDDLIKLKYLPNDWWYHLNQDGEGIAVDFPIKAKPILSWSQQKFVKKDGKLVKGARFPIEKVCLTIIRKPCTLECIF